MEQSNTYRPSYLEEPQVSFLGRILEDVRSGAILVPRFQRRFEWKAESRILLFDSIKQGIPIGSLLVWRTSGRALDVYKVIGGVPISVQEGLTSNQYLLDGHQRITTLLSALTSMQGGDVEEGDENAISAGDALYDLKSKTFVIRRKKQLLDASLMPLSILFNSVELLRFQRQLLTSSFTSDDLIEEIDILADRFRNYKIPLIPLVTNDLESATTAFQRINSSGTDLSVTHMVVALTYSESFDLAEILSNAESKLQAINWEGLDQKFVLATVRALGEIEIARPNVEATSKKVRENPELVEQAIDAICKAALFLRNECNIPSPDFLPYSFQLVLLAYGFSRTSNPSQSVLKDLRDWFWLTTYTGQFRGAREADIELARDDVLTIFDGSGSPLDRLTSQEALPSAQRFDFRSARVKALLIRMAERQLENLPRDSHDKMLDFLAEVGAKAATQLFPPRLLGKNQSTIVANRFLALDHDRLSALRSCELQIFESSEARIENFISDEAFSYLQQGEYSRFLVARAQELAQVEDSFIRKLGLEAS